MVEVMYMHVSRMWVMRSSRLTTLSRLVEHRALYTSSLPALEAPPIHAQHEGDARSARYVFRNPGVNVRNGLEDAVIGGIHGDARFRC